MIMKRIIFIACLMILALPIINAATLSDVRYLVESCQYKEAFKAAEPLLKKSPRDAATNYWYGRAAMGVGQNQKAISALALAADRGYSDAYAQLVSACIDDYDLAKAQKYLGQWKEELRKSNRAAPPTVAELEQRITRLANQLNRVEDICVIAEYKVSKNAFHNAVDKLKGTPRLKETLFLSGNVPFYINNMARDVFWTDEDDNGVSRLYTSGVLDDGTREETVDLTQYIGEGDILAPFMLDDGETLYFSAKRDDGLGGYDLYMTRRDGDGGFYEPSNLGMPYNSPFDDLLLVIDEPNNIGWWVTDRYQYGDSLAVLVFVPNAERKNLSADAADLVDRARVTDIKASQPKGFDLAAAKKRIPRPGEDIRTGNGGGPTFNLSLGDGRIVTSISQFNNRQAAAMMSDLIRAQRIFDDTEQRLDALRRSYADGDKTLKGDIQSLEKDVEKQAADLRNLRNRVIRLETTGR